MTEDFQVFDMNYRFGELRKVWREFKEDRKDDFGFPLSRNGQPESRVVGYESVLNVEFDRTSGEIMKQRFLQKINHYFLSAVAYDCGGLPLPVKPVIVN